MRVFVAGATGAIGRALVPALVERGHHVVGMTRSEAKAAGLRAAGVEPVVCDALDGDTLERAVVEAAPDAVVHQLTDLPRRYSRVLRGTGNTDRLRTDATRRIVAAARACGARRIVAQSLALYGQPSGPALKNEDDPLWLDAPAPMGATIRAVQDLETAVTTTPDLEGIALRYGALYGPGTWYGPDGDVARSVLTRRYPVVGRAGGVISWIHLDDAVSATILAIEGDATGIYNVVDDDPVAYREWLPAYAGFLGARPPLRLPAWLVSVAVGPLVVAIMNGQRGASNGRAKRDLGWKPRYRSWRDGFPITLTPQNTAPASVTAADRPQA